MAKEVTVTKQGLEKLKNELEELKSVKRKEVAEKIKVARGYGDLSENAEYDAAKDEQGKLEARIADLEVTIKNAIVLEDNISTESVSVGTTVKIEDLDPIDEDERFFTYSITGVTENDPDNGKISNESPLGKGLVGKKPGDIAKITMPNGFVVEYKIISIERS